MLIAQATTATSGEFSAFLQALITHAGPLLKFYGLTSGFVLTLFALYRRDNELRQSRRELFHVLVLVLLSFMLQCLVWLSVRTRPFLGDWDTVLSFAAMLLYAAALLYFFGRVAVLSYLRIEKFKERPFLSSLKHLPGIRWIGRKITLVFEKRYETTVGKRGAAENYSVLAKAMGEKVNLPRDRGISVLLAYDGVKAWFRFVARMVDEHLTNGETVTLVVCRHHPGHVVSYLEAEHGDDVLPQECRERLAIVDGFTDVFGGDDEIFHKSIARKRSDGYRIIAAHSVAGIHSGTAAAFKYFKKMSKGKRLPGTVIYDGLLVYRYGEPGDMLARFLTHMLEAERTYQMITVLGEPVAERRAPGFGVIDSLVDWSVECHDDGNGGRSAELIPHTKG